MQVSLFKLVLFKINTEINLKPHYSPQIMWLVGNGFKYENKQSSTRDQFVIYVLNLEALLWKLILTS